LRDQLERERTLIAVDLVELVEDLADLLDELLSVPSDAMGTEHGDLLGVCLALAVALLKKKVAPRKTPLFRGEREDSVDDQSSHTDTP
jgi:hypothetical protein